MIILEPASNHLLVLAGLDQVYGSVGDVLPAGAPVGLMGGTPPGATDILVNSTEGGGADATETLYIELRQDGEAADPAEWFASNKD